MDKKYSMSELGPVIEEVVRNNGKIRLTITGLSMYPLLRNRLDSVLLKRAEEIKKYDILLYTRKDGSYILHRAVCVKENTVDIIADNETEIDVFVDEFVDELMNCNQFRVHPDKLFVAESIERALALYDYDSFMDELIPRKIWGINF